MFTESKVKICILKRRLNIIQSGWEKTEYYIKILLVSHIYFEERDKIPDGYGQPFDIYIFLPIRIDGLFLMVIKQKRK